MRVEKGTASTRTTGEDARRAVRQALQLLVYHFMFGPSYQAGCPVNSSIADSIDGVVPHLHARDVTCSSSHKRRWRSCRHTSAAWPGASWFSAEHTEFNFDLGFSFTEEQARGPWRRWALGSSARSSESATGTGPPIVEQSARSSGTDAAGYLTESPGFSSFVGRRTVYHTYSTTWQGLEFVMGYYPILDHAPKGRDEGEAWQLWIRRHDEYESRRRGGRSDRHQHREGLQLRGTDSNIYLRPSIASARPKARSSMPGLSRPRRASLPLTGCFRSRR